MASSGCFHHIRLWNDIPKCIRFSQKLVGVLAKRRLCIGPAGVVNCTPLSALSFWMSLFPGMCGYNNFNRLYSEGQGGGEGWDGKCRRVWGVDWVLLSAFKVRSGAYNMQQRQTSQHFHQNQVPYNCNRKEKPLGKENQGHLCWPVTSMWQPLLPRMLLPFLKITLNFWFQVLGGKLSY